MDSQKQQAVERIKQSNNILVTVSSNPSVDQLAACIGLTIALNKMGKHATAVFSGNVPSTLEFLQPEKTIEKNTDSLRDFIIALDKSKADKLRYKVEDRVVKIFITPYRTSISDKDLEFSQGDFNVDVVLALGVHNQAELDQAITSHGRILHDATVVTVNLKPGGELGGINWLEPTASSLSELSVQLIDGLDKKLIDTQVATAMLTGIVAETDRFSNAKTSPQTMSISAELMAAGANQQLVATKLQEPVAPPPPPQAPLAHQDANPKATEVKKENDDGTLEIAHEPLQEPSIGLPETIEDSKKQKKADKEPPAEPPASKEEQPEELPVEPPAEPAAEEPEEPVAPPPPQIHIDEHGSLTPVEGDEDYLPPVKHEEPTISHHNEAPKMILEPPTLGGQLTASATPGTFGESAEGPGLPGMPEHDSVIPDSMKEDLEVPSVGHTITPPTAADATKDDEADNAPGTTFLGDQPITAAPEPQDMAKDEADEKPPVPAPNETLSDIERDVHSNHFGQSEAPAEPQPISDQDAAVPSDALPAFDTPAPTAMGSNDANGQMLPPVPSAFPTSDIVLPEAPTPTTIPAPATPQPPVNFNEPILPPTADSAVTSDIDLPMLTPATPSDSSTPPAEDVDNARDAVTQAINSLSGGNLEPSQSLNAQPLSFESPAQSGMTLPSLGDNAVTPAPTTTPQPAADDMPASDLDLSQLGQPQMPPSTNTSDDPNAPPPVPPPMMPVQQ
jgi:hypothetical protein